MEKQEERTNMNIHIMEQLEKIEDKGKKKQNKIKGLIGWEETQNTRDDKSYYIQVRQRKKLSAFR